MGEEFITLVVTEADELARRIRQWNERFLEVKLAQELRTIDVRVEQKSKSAASRLARQELQANQQWLEQKAQRIQLLHAHSEERLVQARKWLDLIGTNIQCTLNSNTFFYLVWSPALIFWTVIITMAVPTKVACPKPDGICHSARMAGLSVRKAVVEMPREMLGKVWGK